MSYMTIDEVTAFALSTCKGATAEDRLLFRPWIVSALRDIGPNRDWYKVAVAYPKDFSIEKPQDLVSTVDISLWNDSNQELAYNFKQRGKRIHTSRFYTNSDQVVNDGQGILEVSEDGNYWHLSTNATEVAYVIIKYLAMPVDQEGFPLIPEDDLLAYEAFCRYFWAKRSDDNRSKIDQDYQIWLRERDRVKGRRKMPSMQEAAAIGQAWLSLISAPQLPNF